MSDRLVPICIGYWIVIVIGKNQCALKEVGRQAGQTLIETIEKANGVSLFQSRILEPQAKAMPEQGQQAISCMIEAAIHLSAHGIQYPKK